MKEKDLLNKIYLYSKLLLRPKWVFFHFYVNKLFSVDATMCRRSDVLLAMSMKTPSKVGYFSKIAEIFGTAKSGPVCPNS